jgi:hypothetical protein
VCVRQGSHKQIRAWVGVGSHGRVRCVRTTVKKHYRRSKLQGTHAHTRTISSVTCYSVYAGWGWQQAAGNRPAPSQPAGDVALVVENGRRKSCSTPGVQAATIYIKQTAHMRLVHGLVCPHLVLRQPTYSSVW